MKKKYITVYLTTLQCWWCSYSFMLTLGSTQLHVLSIIFLALLHLYYVKMLPSSLKMDIDNVMCKKIFASWINFYNPTIRRMVERAYNVNPVRMFMSVCLRDGVSNLSLSFSGRSMYVLWTHFSSILFCSENVNLLCSESGVWHKRAGSLHPTSPNMHTHTYTHRVKLLYLLSYVSDKISTIKRTKNCHVIKLPTDPSSCSR